MCFFVNSKIVCLKICIEERRSHNKRYEWTKKNKLNCGSKSCRSWSFLEFFSWWCHNCVLDGWTNRFVVFFFTIWHGAHLLFSARHKRYKCARQPSTSKQNVQLFLDMDNDDDMHVATSCHWMWYCSCETIAEFTSCCNVKPNLICLKTKIKLIM